MNKLFYKTVLTLSLCIFEAMAADQPTTPSIVVLDIERVLYESEVAKYIQSQVDQERASFQKEVEAYEADLRKQEQALKEKQDAVEIKVREKGPSGKSPVALESTGNINLQKEKERFEHNVSEVQKKVSGKGKLLEERFNGARSAVINKLMDIVGELSEKNYYTLVLPRNAVIYRKDALDITEVVMNILNQQMRTVDLQLKQTKE